MRARRSGGRRIAMAHRGGIPGRRGMATRQPLLECTAELLVAPPRSSINVIDIARQAGTSPAAFYQYFGNVEAAITVLAVNDLAYTAGRLEDAVRANTTGQAPIRLLVKDGEHYRQVAIDWRGGLRQPRLERVPGTPDRLSQAYAPR